MSIKITVLGCGNSHGVPSAGGYWGACNSNNPRNRRFKCSLSVQTPKTSVIIDTGSDLRHQTSKFNIPHVDGVFYTHQHSDHTHGIDDLRPFFFRNERKTIPCYGNKETMQDLKDRFKFMFDGGNHSIFYPVILESHEFNDEHFGNLNKFKDIEYIPFIMDHGTCKSVGYRFGNTSYCVDMKSMDDKALEIVKGSKTWIVDGCGYNNPDNDVHADLETIYRYNEHIGAEKVYITSLSPMMDYKTLANLLPKGYFPAHDGLEIFQEM